MFSIQRNFSLFCNFSQIFLFMPSLILDMVTHFKDFFAPLLLCLFLQGSIPITKTGQETMFTLSVNQIKFTYSRFDNWRTSCTYVRQLLLAFAYFFPYDFFKFSNFSGFYNFILFKHLLIHI